MKQYEYLIREQPGPDDLNALGAIGWKVVSVLWREDAGAMYGEMDRVLFAREWQASPSPPAEVAGAGQVGGKGMTP